MRHGGQAVEADKAHSQVAGRALGRAHGECGRDTKGLRSNKMYKINISYSGMYFVVPFSMERVPDQIYLGHLIAGDPETFLIFLVIDDALDFQSGLCGGGADLIPNSLTNSCNLTFYSLTRTPLFHF